MSKLQNFFKGFKKINYIVPLAEKANVSVVRPDFLNHPLLPNIVEDLSYLNIKDATFGMRSFTATKIDNPSMLLEIHASLKNLICMKITSNIFRNTYKREFDVTIDIYVAGIDDRLWKLRFNPYILYTSIHDEYEKEMLQACVGITDIFIDILGIQKMCQYPINNIECSKFTNTKMRHYDGYIKTLCQFADEPYFGLDYLFPDSTDEKPILVNAVLTNDIEKTMDENLVVHVVRRTSEYDVLMKNELKFDEGMVIPVVRKADNVTDEVAVTSEEGENNNET